MQWLGWIDAITPSDAESRLVGVADDLRVLDPRAPIPCAALLLQLFDDVEDDGVGAVADRVDHDLKAGGIGVEHAFSSSSGECISRPLVDGSSVYGSKNAAVPEPIEPSAKNFMPANAHPVVAEAGVHAGLDQAVDAVVLDRVDARGQLARRAQGLIGAELVGADRHVLHGRHADRGRVRSAGARLVDRLLERWRRDRRG